MDSRREVIWSFGSIFLQEIMEGQNLEKPGKERSKICEMLKKKFREKNPQGKVEKKEEEDEDYEGNQIRGDFGSISLAERGTG